MDCPAQGWLLSLVLELGAAGDARQIYGKEEKFQKSCMSSCAFRVIVSCKQKVLPH